MEGWKDGSIFEWMDGQCKCQYSLITDTSTRVSFEPNLTLTRQCQVGLLGPDIAMAHAKDLLVDGAAGNVAAGTGNLDYSHYLRKLQENGWAGALILHSLDEGQVAESVAFIQEKLTALDRPRAAGRSSL